MVPEIESGMLHNPNPYCESEGTAVGYIVAVVDIGLGKIMSTLVTAREVDKVGL